VSTATLLPHIDAPRPPAGTVLDTNWVLDVWLFNDPRTHAWQQALQRGEVRWLACAAMRVELERVLTYPLVQRGLLARNVAATAVLQAFDQHVTLLPPAPPYTVRCRDADDQIFIDLAVQQQAALLSKDRAVLTLGPRLQLLHGITCQAHWPTL
jgi:putative PIN family toxin of toxin-antitoxin system